MTLESSDMIEYRRRENIEESPPASFSSLVEHPHVIDLCASGGRGQSKFFLAL